MRILRLAATRTAFGVIVAILLTSPDNYLAFMAFLGAAATLIVAPVITVGLIVDVRHQKRAGGQLPAGADHVMVPAASART